MLKKTEFLFAMVILLCFHYSLRFSFVYRPEIMMMTYGFAGFIFLEKHLKNINKNQWQAIVAGAFFGLAMAAHLNGLILFMAGFILMLWNKNIYTIISYAFGVLLTFSIYFFDFKGLSDLELWRHQLFDSPSFHTMFNGSWWLKPIFNLFDEHLRYFYDAKVTVFSLFFFSILIIGYKHIRQNHAILLRFYILIAIITGLLAKNKGGHYLLINLPYMLLIITLIIKALKDNKIHSWPFHSYISGLNLQRVILLLFFVFIVVSTIINYQFSRDKFTSDLNRIIAQRYSEDNSADMNVIAPLTFIFNEIENFNKIQGDLCYKEFQRLDPSIRGEGILEKMESFDIGLGMFSSKYQQRLGIDMYETGDTIRNYKVIDKTEDLLIFRRLR